MTDKEQRQDEQAAPVESTPPSPSDEEQTPGEPAGAVEDLEETEALGDVDKVTARLRAVSAAYQKLQGEMGAFRQRMERLQEERERRRRGEVVTAMFEPVQNLRRSIDMLRNQDEELVKGLELVLAQFQGAMKKLGLEEIAATGVLFDPALHEALCTVAVPAPELDGVVVQVFDAGYRIGDHVIQPARVVIGAHAAASSSEE